MEINLNNLIQNSNPATTNNSTGIAAPQTDAQRADVAATRVVSPKETANLENQAQSADKNRFDAVRTTATSYVEGKNKFLQDFKFTIYGSSKESVAGEYYIRFTDLSTGNVEVKTEQQLLGVNGGGNLVNGNI